MARERRRTKRLGRKGRGVAGKTRLFRLLRLLEWSFYGLSALVVIGAAVIAGTIYRYSDGLPPLTPLENYAVPGSWGQTTRVYASDGETLIGEFYEENREIIPLERIPLVMREAVIAVEDERFDRSAPWSWTRNLGVDPWGIMRASMTNLWASIRSGRPRIIQGGSTITQQLAKNLFLDNERTFRRKIQEAILAYRIEERFSRDEIMERYLNKVYFGNGAYGIQAAARRYFGSNLTDTSHTLSLGEAALLAGLVRAPSHYSPVTHPDNARIRQITVLSRMVDRGYVTREEADSAVEEFWRTYQPEAADSGDTLDEGGAEAELGGFFVEYVRQTLLDGSWPRDAVYRGGLRVVTTLDPGMQRAAENAVAEGLARLNGEIASRRSSGDPGEGLEAALIAIDPRNGHILAMVGGSSWGPDNRFNRAIQARRQPGSAFKPFVYMTALEEGIAPDDPPMDPEDLDPVSGDPVDPFRATFIRGGGRVTPATIVRDESFSVPVPGGRDWTPHNYGHDEHGPVTVRAALRRSLNIASVRVLMTVSPSRVIERVRAFGVDTSEMEPYPSLALGVFGVTPIEIASAYGAFANHGIRVEPYPLVQVTTSEGRNFDYDPRPASEAASPQISFLMTSLLQDVVLRGTARGAVGSRVRRPCAGKTGTTDDYADAWFVGFTPDLACAVWVGFDERRSMGRGMSGSHCAGRIWGDFVAAALAERPVLPFDEPEGIVREDICSVTGLLPTEYCPDVETEYFLEGTQPTQICRIHEDQITFEEWMYGEIVSDTLLVPTAPDPGFPFPPPTDPLALPPSGDEGISTSLGAEDVRHLLGEEAGGGDVTPEYSPRRDRLGAGDESPESPGGRGRDDEGGAIADNTPSVDAGDYFPAPAP